MAWSPTRGVKCGDQAPSLSMPKDLLSWPCQSGQAGSLWHQKAGMAPEGGPGLQNPLVV